MRLFVTGGTGFIGSHFLNLAAHRGHTVIALRRKGSQPRVPVLKEPHWIEGDLDADFATEFKGIDCLVHLASHSANTPYDNLPNCLYWNVLASARLLTSAISSGVSRFVIAGTCFEYGLSANDFEFIPPSAPLRPIWTYPISKAAASEVFMGLARDHQVNLSILRLFQIFGEGEQESRFYPSLCRAALAGHDFEMSSGEKIRDKKKPRTSGADS